SCPTRRYADLENRAERGNEKSLPNRHRFPSLQSHLRLSEVVACPESNRRPRRSHASAMPTGLTGHSLLALFPGPDAVGRNHHPLTLGELNTLTGNDAGCFQNP